jgi:hypothetical protein
MEKMFHVFCAPVAGESRYQIKITKALNDGKGVLHPRSLVSYPPSYEYLNFARSFDYFDLLSGSETEEREMTDYNELILAHVRKRRETKQQYNSNFPFAHYPASKEEHQE